MITFAKYLLASCTAREAWLARCLSQFDLQMNLPASRANIGCVKLTDMNDRPSETDADLAREGSEELPTNAPGMGDESASATAFDALIVRTSVSAG